MGTTMKAKLDALMKEAGVSPGEAKVMSVFDFALILEKSRGDVRTPELAYVWDGSKYVKSILCGDAHPDAPKVIDIDAYFTRTGRFG